MCVVSMTGDMFNQRWLPWAPYIPPMPYAPQKESSVQPFIITPQGPTKEDYEALKREVEILKDLLKTSKAYDEKNGEPDCEIDAKMKFLTEVAKLVGVDLQEVLKKKNG